MEERAAAVVKEVVQKGPDPAWEPGHLGRQIIGGKQIIAPRKQQKRPVNSTRPGRQLVWSRRDDYKYNCEDCLALTTDAQYQMIRNQAWCPDTATSEDRNPCYLADNINDPYSDVSCPSGGAAIYVSSECPKIESVSAPSSCDACEACTVTVTQKKIYVETTETAYFRFYLCDNSECTSSSTIGPTSEVYADYNTDYPVDALYGNFNSWTGSVDLKLDHASWMFNDGDTKYIQVVTREDPSDEWTVSGVSGPVTINREGDHCDAGNWKDDMDNIDGLCDLIAVHVGIYMLPMVPWAAFIYACCVFCFWKSTKQDCTCGCDNNKCCPIPGIIFSVIHLIAMIALVNIVFTQLSAAESMMDHQGDGWGTDFSYGLHFGGIWSFLVYAGVLIGTIVLMCMKIEQPAAATEEVAAVAATPAPIAAQAVAMAVPAEAKV